MSRLRMRDLQHGLKVVEIVTGQNPVDPGDPLLDVVRFQLIEMMKKWRDFRLPDEGVEILEDLRQVPVNRAEFLCGLVRLGNRQGELHFDPVAVVVFPHLRSNISLLGDNFGFNWDIAPQLSDIDFLPGNIS